jgi:hypothetical protein
MSSNFIFKIVLISTCFWQSFCFDAQARVDSHTRKHSAQTGESNKITKEEFLKQYCSKKKRHGRYPIKCVVPAMKAYKKKYSNNKQ